MQREQVFKRCWEPEIDLWTCRPKKRIRLGTGLSDGSSPMEMLSALVREEEKKKTVGKVEQGVQVYLLPPGSPHLSCVRCLAGEPGHINHMRPGGGGALTNSHS